jgi:hypothetical protein
MPHSIKWYVEGQIIFVRFQGVMTVEDVQKCLDSVLPFYDQAASAQVHNLIDVRYITSSLSQVELIKLIQKTPHPRMGWTVQIDPNQTLIRHLTNVLSQLFSIRSRSFNSFDEGLTFLASQDETIRWEQANLSALNPDVQAGTK